MKTKTENKHNEATNGGAVRDCPDSAGSLSEIEADRQWIQGARHAINCYEAGVPGFIHLAIGQREKQILEARKENVEDYHGVSDGGANGIDSSDWLATHRVSVFSLRPELTSISLEIAINVLRMSSAASGEKSFQGFSTGP